MGIKEAYEKAKKEHSVLIMSDEDAEEACEFVSKLLQIEIDRLEENESYATKTIAEYKNAESKAYHIFNEIQDEIEKGEDSKS